jgi:outer membrane protein, heavy metal efflux system
MAKQWLKILLLIGLGVWCAVPACAQTRHPAAEHTAGQEHPSGVGAATVTLEQLIQEALDNNPLIQASQNSADAKRSLILPSQTLPDPMFKFQNMGDLWPPTLQEGDPSSARTYGFEQDIPFPGKLGLKGKMTEMEAEAERWNTQQTRHQVIVDLKSAYYDLYLIHKALATIEKDRDLLRQFTRIAEEKYRVGQGIQQDVLKAHVELSKLIDRQMVLEQRRGSSEAQINGLLHRPAGTPLGKPAEVKKAELRYSLEQLQGMAEANFPELKVREREIDRNQYAVELSQKNYYPDFTLGFTYFERTVPSMYGYMFNVKVPLYFWRKQRNELESAAFSLESAKKQRDNTLATLHAGLRDAYLVAGTSERLVNLYGSSVIPQAKLALESSLAGYQVGRVDFLALIDSLVTLLDYELKYYEVLTDFQKALARLEPYVGSELTR